MTFNYNSAIVRGVPNSFANALRMEEPENAINVSKAKDQHSTYVNTLKKYLTNVFELDSDESVPDCMFIEDTTVAINSTVVITQLGHTTRRPEAEAVKQKYISLLGEQNVVDMKATDPSALADGGDILFTGSELFVGISKRTNEQAARVLAGVFKQTPVHCVPVVEGLHLKSVVTCACPGVIIVADNVAGREACEVIKKVTTVSYKYVFVPDAAASNVLNIKGHLLIPTGYPKSKQILEKLIGEATGIIDLIEIDNSEGAKADGALTCCSVLFQLP